METLGKEDHLALLDLQDPVEQLDFMMETHCAPIPAHQVALDIQAYQA